MLTKLWTGFGLIMQKWEDLARGLEGCWELVSECINACVSKKVCWLLDRCLQPYEHASPFIGNKEAVAFQTASPLNYSMQLNNYRAPLSCIKLQNGLPPLPWINAIFSFWMLHYSLEWVAWSNAWDTWRKNRKHSKKSMERNWHNTVRTLQTEAQTAAGCGEMTVSEIEHALCPVVSSEPVPVQKC